MARRFVQFGNLVGTALVVLSTSLTVFFRFHVGCRFTVNIWISLFGFGFYSIVAAMVIAPAEKRLPILIFISLFFIFALGHQGSVFIRRKGHGIHSHSSGRSWLELLLRLPPAFIQFYLEPAIGILVGYAVQSVAPALGLWLIAAGIALFADQQIERFIRWRRLWDTLDSRSDAKSLSDMVQDQATPSAHSKNGNGLTVKRPPAAGRGSSVNFRSGLDDGIRKFLDEKESQNE